MGVCMYIHVKDNGMRIGILGRSRSTINTDNYFTYTTRYDYEIFAHTISDL